MASDAILSLYWLECRRGLQIVVDAAFMTYVGIGQATRAIGVVDGVQNGTRAPPCLIWLCYDWGRRVN